MLSLQRLLPGFPSLSEEEARNSSLAAELEDGINRARQRLESVETLADSSLRDSRLLAEYLEKDLEHLSSRMQELGAIPGESKKAGNLFEKLKRQFRSRNPENLKVLHSFYSESGESTSHLSDALRQAAARLDYLEQSWKEIRPAYLTSRDRYMQRLRRIGWITLAVVILGVFGGYRVYRIQPDQKFARKHLQPLKSVLDPQTYSRMEGLAQASRSDFLRVEDLIKIRIGLETFQQARGRFPGSEGELFNSDGAAGTDWIPEIRTVVPATLPVDRRSGEDPREQYLYISNGQQYKVLAQTPENCPSIKEWMPELLDPVRGCGAIGFWTDGARDF
ncbi:MAG: hypothetical protein RH862_10170 [Leptospiraceae bacterium]